MMIISASCGMVALLFSATHFFAAAHFLSALSLAAVNVCPPVIIYLVMAAIITTGETDHTVGQIYFQRYFSGARLCACHSQYHHRYSGHLNELFFHNCAFF